MDGKLVGWATFQREKSDLNAVYMNGPYHYPQVIFASVFLRSVSQGFFLLRRKERMEGLKKHGN